MTTGNSHWFCALPFNLAPQVAWTLNQWVTL